MEAEYFARFTPSPYLTAIEQAIGSDPDLCLPDEYVEFDLSRFERARRADPGADLRAGPSVGLARRG